MTRKKLILIVATAVVAVAAGATTYFAVLRDPPPPNPETAKPEEVTRFLASDQFARMPVEKKQKYFESLHSQHRENPGPPHRMMQAARNLPEKEREKLRENMGSMFRARMEQEVNHYFELPEEQRTAYLDEMIDRHEQFRQRMVERRANRSENRPREDRPDDQQRRRRGGRGRHRTPERHKQRIKRMSGEQRARFTEFMQAMRKCRKERGLPERRGPGRRR